MTLSDPELLHLLLVLICSSHSLFPTLFHPVLAPCFPNFCSFPIQDVLLFDCSHLESFLLTSLHIPDPQRRRRPRCWLTGTHPVLLSSTGLLVMPSWWEPQPCTRLLFLQPGLPRLLRKSTDPCRLKPQRFIVSNFIWALDIHLRISLDILWKTNRTINKRRKKKRSRIIPILEESLSPFYYFSFHFFFYKEGPGVSLQASWDEAKYTILCPNIFQLHSNISVFSSDNKVSINVNFSNWLVVHHVDRS